VECDRVLQQTIGPANVHGTGTNGIHAAMGPLPLRCDHSLERRRCHRCSRNMPATCKELELQLARNLRWSTQLLLRNGCHQPRHRRRDDITANAVLVQAADGVAQEVGCDGASQHWSRVSTRANGVVLDSY